MGHAATGSGVSEPRHCKGKQMEQGVRFVGVLGFAVIGVGLWLGIIGSSITPRKVPIEIKSPILAIELAKTPAEVNDIVEGPKESNRDTIRTSVKVDFFFIALYWLLFVAVALILSTRRFAWSLWLALTAGVCGTAAAGFDVLENFRLFRILETTTTETLDSVRFATLSKWWFTFTTLALLAPVFFWRQDPVFWQKYGIIAIGFIYLFTASVGWWGLWYDQPAIIAFASSLLMPLGLLTVACLFTFWPYRFLEGF
jgi:hypothetical protein